MRRGARPYGTRALVQRARLSGRFCWMRSETSAAVCALINSNGKSIATGKTQKQNKNDTHPCVPFCLDCSVPWVYVINFKRKKKKRGGHMGGGIKP